jgi:pimeloyl-ACP methyl ester carboxylesterase
MSKIQLILVPGLAADERLWRPVIEKLDGVAESAVAKCTGDSIAAWGDEVLANAPDRFYIVGTSMGGYVALDVALRADKRVAGVILLNTNARAASPEQRQRGAALIDMVRNGLFEQVVEKMSGFVAGARPDLAEPVAAMSRDAGPEVFMRQQQAVLDRLDRREALTRLGKPALVIAGDDDRLAPPSLNNEMARAIPKAQLEILPCGHLSTLELPGEVAGMIQRWLAAQEAAHGPA